MYLSIGGELSAMFVISYVGDEGMARALHGLTKRGITLLVRTCDPNVTEELICSVYELDPYYVEVLGATAGRSYSNLVKGCEPESEAVLASNGRLEGMADSLARCSRAAHRRRPRGGAAGGRRGAGPRVGDISRLPFRTAVPAAVFPGVFDGLGGPDLDGAGSPAQILTFPDIVCT